MSVKITQFEAENVKRIKSLTLTPAPTGLTVIGGRNNQGKTSGLDAIVRALNPECGFLLLDKLEQMDLETLREFSEWMESEGLQGIATRVSTGGECSIIIEDGCAAPSAPPVGCVYLAEDFGKLLNLLGEVVGKEINVVLTAHAMMRKFEQPDEMGAYDRWELKLQKKTAALVKEWSDLLLFANYKTVTVAADKDGKRHKAHGGKRVIYTTHHPCWDAKNRQGLPEELPLDFQAIAPYLFPENPAPEENFLPVAQKHATLPHLQPKGRSRVPSPASADIPAALSPLLESADVTETEVREVIAEKGYFTMETPWTVMEQAGFVDGWVLPWWDKIVEIIRSNPNRLPF